MEWMILLFSVPLTEMVVVGEMEKLESSTFLTALKCLYWDQILIFVLITETDILGLFVSTVGQMVMKLGSFVVRYQILVGHW